MSVFAALDTTVDLVTPENIAFRYQLAGPFRRLPAFVMDFAIKVFTVLLILILFSCAGFSMGQFTGSLALGFAMLGWFIVEWFYGVFFEAVFNGKTPGKWACGIRVVSVDGHPINGVQALLRNLLRGVDLFPMIGLEYFGADGSTPSFIPTCMVGLVVMACNRRMQRLGDLSAGTMVIVDERAWQLPIVKIEDPRVQALAAYMPADFRASRTLSRALAQYAERRAYLSPVQRREISKRLADPLIERFDFSPEIDPDLLLYSLYWRVFLSDRRSAAPELGSLAGYSPMRKDAHPVARSLPQQQVTP